MKTTAIAIVSVAIVAASFQPAQAQQAGRFIMEKTPEGYMRMDTQTGEMSVCRMHNEQIVCKMAADERAAFQDELEALEDRVAELESRLGTQTEGGLPSEEEFERTLSYMERFMRRFMDIVEDDRGPAGDRT